jgi:hypothetical protein
MRAVGPSLAALAALAVLSACGGSGSGTGVTVPGQSQLPPPTTTTVETRLAPTTPEELEVELDPDGRPYDVQGASDSTVEWGPFEHAYGTDGGVGAVTSQAVIGVASTPPARDSFIEDVDHGATYQLFDLDGAPGVDSMIFSNGFGDGGFPLSRGYDEAGEMVAVMIWDNRFPWRLAVPDGTPPPDVTERGSSSRSVSTEPAP